MRANSALSVGPLSSQLGLAPYTNSNLTTTLGSNQLEIRSSISFQKSPQATNPTDIPIAATIQIGHASSSSTAVVTYIQSGILILDQ